MTRTVGQAKSDYKEPHWEDKGCDYEPSCLECTRPLDQCPDMVPKMKQRITKERKSMAIRACRADGFTVKEIAESLKISERTVTRALKGDKKI